MRDWKCDAQGCTEKKKKKNEECGDDHQFSDDESSGDKSREYRLHGKEPSERKEEEWDQFDEDRIEDMRIPILHKMVESLFEHRISLLLSVAISDADFELGERAEEIIFFG